MFLILAPAGESPEMMRKRNIEVWTSIFVDMEEVQARRASLLLFVFV